MNKSSIKVANIITITLLGVITIALAIFYSVDLIPVTSLTWRGIGIGRSSKDDVIGILGNPSHLEYGILTTKFIYEERGLVTGFHHVILRFGVVQQIVEDRLVYPFSEDLRLTTLVQEYGPPARVEWSRDGPHLRTVFFSNVGIIAIVNAAPLEDAVVTKVVYHKPFPPPVLRVKLHEYIPIIDPFPDSDIIGPKDPWFGTSNICRTRCD
jgi:hypothetical protein